MKSNPKSSSPCVTSNEALLYFQGPLWVKLYLFHRYSGIGAIWGNWAQIPQIMYRNTWKVIQSLQLLVSHQLRLCSSVRAIFWLSWPVLNFLSRMGFINSFGQGVQEILLNNYLKSNFENSEIRDFIPTFWNFIREKSLLKKPPLFGTLNGNMLRNAYHRKINEPILKFCH